MGTDVTVVGGWGYIVYIELCQCRGFESSWSLQNFIHRRNTTLLLCPNIGL